VSARLTRDNTGSRMCVASQERHLARRGRTDTAPAGPRRLRVRPQPHRASTPPQSGHDNSPSTRRCSTTKVVTSTVIKAPSVGAHTALPDAAKRAGGP
jgi:hypothetical protein